MIRLGGGNHSLQYVARLVRAGLLGIFFLSSLFSTGSITRAAGVPRILYHQGRLLDSSTNALGGNIGANYCFRFSLYNTASVGSGTKLWPTNTPSTMTVLVKNGTFTAPIGDTSAGGDILDINFQDYDTVYLNVEVAAQVSNSCGGVTFETLSPRQRIAAVAYALSASSISGTGQSTIGTTTPFGSSVLSVQATSTGAVPVAVRGATGQAVDLLQLQTAAGLNLLRIDQTGALFSSSTLQVSGAARLYNNLTVDGVSSLFNLVVTNATSTNATSTNLAVTGQLTLTGATITGLSSSNLSDAANLAKLAVNQTFSGLNTFSATTTFTTTTIASSTVTTENVSNLTVNNSLSLPVNSITDAMVVDSITASNYLLLSGGTLTGLTALQGGFISTASSSISAGLQVAGALNASSSLLVGGAATLNSTLGVSGLTTATGGFISSASSSVAGGLQVAGALNASSTFLANGLSTLSGGVLVNASTSTITNLFTSFSTSTNATSTNLAVTGQLTLTGATITGLSTDSLSDAATLARLSSDQTFSGLNTFSATTTFSTTTIASSSVTTQNVGTLTVNNSISLPDNSITDAMVVDSITASNYLLLSGGTLTGLTSFENGFISNASSSIGGGLQVTGPLNASSSLLVGGAATLNSTLGVSGLTTLTSGFISSASSSIGGGLQIAGPLNASSTLLVNELSTLTGGFISNASSSIGGTLSISGATTVSSTFLVAGLSTFQGGLIISASSSIGAGLQVAGPLSASGTLQTGGLATFGTGFISIASSSIAGALSISGTTTLSSNLIVSGGNIVHNLGNPTFSGGYDDSAINANAVFANGRYAFLGKATSAGTCSASDPTGCEIQIFDVSTSSPTYLGGIDVGSAVNAITGFGDYLVFGTNAASGFCSATTATGCELQMYNMFNPLSPVYSGGIDATTQIKGLAMEGGRVVIAKAVSAATCTFANPAGCEIQLYDLSGPSSTPRFMGGANDAGGSNFDAVALSGRRAYIGKASNSGTCSSTDNTGCELQIYDITASTTALIYIGGVDNGDNTANGITVNGMNVFLVNNANTGTCSSSTRTGCELQLFDVINPTNPTYKNGLDLTDATKAVMSAGRYLYVGKNASNGASCSISTPANCEIQVYDVSTSALTFVGGVDSGSGVSGTTVNALYVAGRRFFIGVGGSVDSCRALSENSAHGCEFQYYDVGGIETGGLISHTAEIGGLQVLQNAFFDNSLFLRGGLFAGVGGISSEGGLSVIGTTTLGSALTVVGTINASGTLAITGGSGAGGLKITASNSSTTITSFASGSGAGAFIFDTNSALSTASSSILFSLRNAGSKVLSVDTGGNVRSTGTITSNAAGSTIGDLAEYVDLSPGDTSEPGDVLISDPENPNKFKKSTSAYAVNVAGVISDTGRFLIGVSGENRGALALSGLVNTKVTDENGPISTGDYVVTASRAGYAMRYDLESGKTASIIGMALEPLATSSARITILIIRGLALPGSPSSTSVTSSALSFFDTESELGGTEILTTSTVASSSSFTISPSSSLVIGGLTVNGPTVLNGMVSVIGDIDFLATTTFEGSAFFADQVRIASTLTVSGTIAASRLVANEIVTPGLSYVSSTVDALASTTADLGIQLASSTMALSAVASTTDYLFNRMTTLENQSNLTLANLASSSLSIDQPGILRAGLQVDMLSSISGAISVGSEILFIGRPYFNADSGGFVVVPPGQKNVAVEFQHEYLEQPVVNATLSLETTSTLSADEAAALEEIIFTEDIRYIIIKKTTRGFTLHLSKPAPFELTFSWIALAVKNARRATVIPSEIVESPSGEVLPTDTTSTISTPSVTPPVDELSTSSEEVFTPASEPPQEYDTSTNPEGG